MTLEDITTSLSAPEDGSTVASASSPSVQSAPQPQSEVQAVPAAGPSVVPSWLEQDDILRDMWLKNEQPQVIADKLGRSMAAVMTRAVRLGLPRRAAPGRKPGYRRMEGANGAPPKARVSGAVSRMAAEIDQLHDAEHERRASQQAMRVCLMCLKKFMSQGSHNRICPSCKGSSQYVAASSLPDMSYKVET